MSDHSTQRILVTGGTGALGRQLVTKLKKAGYVVRAMTRRRDPGGPRLGVEWAQADLETGAGLREAVQSVDTIAHAATSPFRNPGRVDVEGTRRLMEVAHAAGVGHLIYLSIVGIERIPFAYYQHKLAAEAIVAGGSLPWSVLRATQFHTLLDSFLQALARLPFFLLPTDFQYQSIDPGEVADEVIRRVSAGPSGRAPDMGGPEVENLEDLVPTWMEARGLRRPLIHLPIPGKMAHAFREGYNTTPHNRQGRVTWAEWLNRKYRSRSIHSTKDAEGE